MGNVKYSLEDCVKQFCVDDLYILGSQNNSDDTDSRFLLTAAWRHEECSPAGTIAALYRPPLGMVSAGCLGVARRKLGGGDAGSASHCPHKLHSALSRIHRPYWA